MSMSTSIGSLLYSLACLATAMVGHHIHGSVFWAITDFLFPFFVWAKWLIMHQVSLSIIKATFAFFTS